jgi:hypothetical protein
MMILLSETTTPMIQCILQPTSHLGRHGVRQSRATNLIIIKKVYITATHSPIVGEEENISTTGELIKKSRAFYFSRCAERKQHISKGKSHTFKGDIQLMLNMTKSFNSTTTLFKNY